MRTQILNSGRHSLIRKIVILLSYIGQPVRELNKN